MMRLFVALSLCGVVFGTAGGVSEPTAFAKPGGLQAFKAGCRALEATCLATLTSEGDALPKQKGASLKRMLDEHTEATHAALEAVGHGVGESPIVDDDTNIDFTAAIAACHQIQEGCAASGAITSTGGTCSSIEAHCAELQAQKDAIEAKLADKAQDSQIDYEAAKEKCENLLTSCTAEGSSETAASCEEIKQHCADISSQMAEAEARGWRPVEGAESETVAEHIGNDADTSHLLTYFTDEHASNDEHGEGGPEAAHAMAEGDEHGEHGEHGDGEHGEHGEHEHHAEVSIFDERDSLDVESTTYTLLLLIVFTMIFLECIEHLRHATHHYAHYKAMIDKVFEELTILGFISFCLTVLIQAGAVKHGVVLTSFEFSHVLIFFIAMILVIQAINVAKNSRSLKKNWAAFRNIAKQDNFLEDFSSRYGHWIAKEEQCCLLRCFNYCRFRMSKECREIEYRLLRQIFMVKQRHNKPIADKRENFDFAMFLEIGVNEVIVDFLEIENFTWLVVLALGGIIVLIYATGHTLEHNSGKHLFNILGYVIFAMAVILWIWCKSSEEKILQWAGCRNASASALWDTFYDLETLSYDELIKKDLHSMKHAGRVLSRGKHPQSPGTTPTAGNNLLPSGRRSSDDVEMGTRDFDDSVHPDATQPIAISSSPRNPAIPTFPAVANQLSAEEKEEEMPQKDSTDLMSVYPFHTTKIFHLGLDMLNMFTCLHLGLYLVHFAHRMEEIDRPLMFMCPIPDLLVIFWVNPDIMRLLVLMSSVTCANSDLLTHTLAYMADEEQLSNTVLDKMVHQILSEDGRSICKAKVNTMFADLDADNSGELDHKELRVGLAEYFQLNYTNTQFHKVLRVLDPDQSGGIDRKEFLDLMVNHLKTQQEKK